MMAEPGEGAPCGRVAQHASLLNWRFQGPPQTSLEQNVNVQRRRPGSGCAGSLTHPEAWGSGGEEA